MEKGDAEKNGTLIPSFSPQGRRCCGPPRPWGKGVGDGHRKDSLNSNQGTWDKRRRFMILVTGSTGLNGYELVIRLSKRGVPVRALVRNPAKAEKLSHLPGVEIAIGDMAKPETLVEALRGVDRAMLISSSVP